MVRVRLREDGPRQYRNRSGIHADEDDPEVDVAPDQAAYLVDETGYFEFVEDDPRIAAADEGDIDEVSIDPGEYTLEELEAELASGDYDDVLDELAAREREGKARDGAYALIDARRE